MYPFHFQIKGQAFKEPFTIEYGTTTIYVTKQYSTSKRLAFQTFTRWFVVRDPLIRGGPLASGAVPLPFLWARFDPDRRGSSTPLPLSQAQTNFGHEGKVVQVEGVEA